MAEAPIERLPDDVFAEIFVAINDDDDETRIHTFFQAQRSFILPARLTCRRWNEVIIDLAQLWTYIDLDCRKDLNHRPTPGKMWSLKQLETWIARSKNMKLSLHLWIGLMTIYQGREITDPYAHLKPIADNMHRLGALYITRATAILLFKAVQSISPSQQLSTLDLPLAEALIISEKFDVPRSEHENNIPIFRAEVATYICLAHLIVSATNYARIAENTPRVDTLHFVEFYLSRHDHGNPGEGQDTTYDRKKKKSDLLNQFAHRELISISVVKKGAPASMIPFYRTIFQGSTNLIIVDLFFTIQVHDWITINSSWADRQHPIPSVKYLRYHVAESTEGGNLFATSWDPFLRWFPNILELDLLAGTGCHNEKHGHDFCAAFVREIPRYLEALKYLKIVVLRYMAFAPSKLVDDLKRLARANPSLQLCFHACVLVNGEERIPFSTPLGSDESMTKLLDWGDDAGDYVSEGDETWQRWTSWAGVKDSLNMALSGIWDSA